MTETFVSNKLPISADIFGLQKGRHPAIIFLHGANGLSSHPKSYYRFATLLANSGYTVFLVHYFDSTGTTQADNQAICKHFFRWSKIAYDAISFAAKKSNILSEHLGLLGTSLGATLALSLLVLEPKIRVVAEFSGAMPPLAAALVKSMPPTLIIHGSKDDVVPVAGAYTLERLLKKRNVPYEIKIYPEEGHIFNMEAARDAAQHTVDFFDKYLRPPL